MGRYIYQYPPPVVFSVDNRLQPAAMLLHVPLLLTVPNQFILSDTGSMASTWKLRSVFTKNWLIKRIPRPQVHCLAMSGKYLLATVSSRTDTGGYITYTDLLGLYENQLDGGEVDPDKMPYFKSNPLIEIAADLIADVITLLYSVSTGRYVSLPQYHRDTSMQEPTVDWIRTIAKTYPIIKLNIADVRSVSFDKLGITTSIPMDIVFRPLWKATLIVDMLYWQLANPKVPQLINDPELKPQPNHLRELLEQLSRRDLDDPTSLFFIAKSKEYDPRLMDLAIQEYTEHPLTTLTLG